jgi:hypothetical protein
MCGEMNAKNSYGGYIGYTNFVVHFVENNPKEIDMSYKEADCSMLDSKPT